MKTIRQIADEIGVSKDSLRKRISREPLKSYIEPHTEVKDGIKYINSVGMDVIKQAYVPTDNPTDVRGDVPTDKADKSTRYAKDTTVDVPTDVLRIIENMRADHKAELEVKNKQIEELNARLAEITELANTSQRLHAGTIQQQLTTANGEQLAADELEAENHIASKPHEKQRFWSGIFGKKKGSKNHDKL